MNICSWKAEEVTLADGSVVLSNSEAWRAQCEALYALNLSEEARINFLESVKSKRGAAPTQKLQEDMRKVEHLHILDRIHGKENRKKYLDGIEMRHGFNERKSLERRILELWRSRQPVAE